MEASFEGGNSRPLKIYLAGGWFTPAQERTLNYLEEALSRYPNKFVVFSPRKATLILPGTQVTDEVRKKVFSKNLEEIEGCDLIIASTEDKDMGTLFECGYGYAKGKPIIYVNFSIGNKPFNLMLQESGIAVAKDRETFEKVLDILVNRGLDLEKLGEYRDRGITE
jgi:nucleoside 2-deoxyribosyltransferase